MKQVRIGYDQMRQMYDAKVLELARTQEQRNQATALLGALVYEAGQGEDQYFIPQPALEDLAAHYSGYNIHEDDDGITVVLSPNVPTEDVVEAVVEEQDDA